MTTPPPDEIDEALKNLAGIFTTVESTVDRAIEAYGNLAAIGMFASYDDQVAIAKAFPAPAWVASMEKWTTDLEELAGLYGG